MKTSTNPTSTRYETATVRGVVDGRVLVRWVVHGSEELVDKDRIRPIEEGGRRRRKRGREGEEANVRVKVEVEEGEEGGGEGGVGGAGNY